MQFHGPGPGHIHPHFRLAAPRGCPLAHSRRTGASHPADLLPLSDTSMHPELMAKRSHALHLPYRADIVLLSYKLQYNPTIIHEITSTFWAMITSSFEIGGIAPQYQALPVSSAPCLVIIACPPNNNPYPRRSVLGTPNRPSPSSNSSCFFCLRCASTDNKRRPRKARQ